MHGPDGELHSCRDRGSWLSTALRRLAWNLQAQCAVEQDCRHRKNIEKHIDLHHEAVYCSDHFLFYWDISKAN